jgi:serine protease inhibitor
MTTKVLFPTCVFITMLCGCLPAMHPPDPVNSQPGPVAVIKTDPLISAVNNRFAFTLLEELRFEKPDINLFMSPLSLSMALAMSANGAAGDTLAAITRALQMGGMSTAQINPGLRALKTALMAADPTVKLAIADSLWAHQDVPFKSAFLAVNHKFYDADVATLDFGEPRSVNTINRWVDRQTRGLIDKIIDPETLQGLTMLLLDAVYFKGRWSEPFQKGDTRDHSFALLEGEKTVQMMSQTGMYEYLETEGFQAVRLPYGNKRLELLVFLPAKKSSLADFCKTLTPEKWGEWLGQMAERDGTIGLPRFTATYDVTLNDALAALGMGLAFDSEKADFSAMSDQHMWLDFVRQKAYLKVDEEGTEAAAVTAVAPAGCAVPPPGPQPFEMIVDRPFFLAIHDRDTDTILFMGTIVDPEE